MRKILAALLFCLVASQAFAQVAPTVLPSGCGTGNAQSPAIGYLTADSDLRLCVESNTGPSSGVSQPQLAVTTGAVVTPAVPTSTTTAILAVRTGAAGSINYCWDGLTTPTTGATGACFQLNAGQTVSILGASNVANLRLIATATNTAVDIGYTK